MNQIRWAAIAISAIVTSVTIWYFYEENRRAEEKHVIAMKVQQFFYDQAVSQDLIRRNFHESD